MGFKFLRDLRRQRSAFALITVISFLGLVMVLLLGLFGTANIEVKSSTNFKHAVEAKELSSVATNIVIAQIRRATYQGESSSPTAWSSQPGAIHTWDSSGNYLKGYKLYSDASMFASQASEILQDLPDSDWDEQAGRYGDLNRPYITHETGGTSKIRFPIVDPRAMIDDQATVENDQIEGFGYDANAVNGIVGPTGRAPDPDLLRLPMPVEWLYVLKDGTTGVAEESDGGFRFVGPKQPTEENPIVGRVAFWTDDEASKLNVNTASEPTPWDTPRCGNRDDYDYGTYQPANREWQRYPGHPFTTGLGPVFFPNRDATSTEKESLYTVLPRVREGGTKGGTVRPSSILIPDDDRLFASFQEFVLWPDREEQDLITPERLDTSRFFLTAHSRAPELNAFGLPRIAIWPIGAGGFARTEFDNLIAFCSTVGGKEFYFQRRDANSKTADWTNISRNQELYAYLQRLTSENIPGVGKSLKDNWGLGRSSDRDQILTEIFDYIRCANLREKTAGGAHFAGSGQAMPIELPNGTKGFGRFFSISEFAFHFICNQDGDDVDGDGNKPDGVKPSSATEDLDEGERYVEAAFLMEPFCPSQGFFVINNDFSVRVSGLESFTLDGQPLEFQSNITYKPSSLSRGFHGRNWGGPTGVRTWINGGGYPMVGRKSIKVDSTGENPTMQFSGGQLTVEVFRGGSASASNLVQTIHLNFPPETFPVPKLVETGTSDYRGASVTGKDHWWTFNRRYSSTTSCPQAAGPEYADPTRQYPLNRGHQNGFKSGSVFRFEDVVRTMVPYHGDMRLVAGRSDVPSTIFRPHRYYDDINRRVDHLFNDTQGTHHLYGFSNEPTLKPYLNDQNQLETDTTFDPENDAEDRVAQLTPVRYHYSRLPDVPVGTGVHNKWGDFDNGCAQIHDGAYINKPDDGNIASKGGGHPSYFAWNFNDPGLVQFSPNRLMPSPGMFGSLPTGVSRQEPWQTLLFRPQEGHPGEDEDGAPEHHLLDLFWMPVIEPWAISEPFATAGKVNLNHRIAPFSYITRTTALRGLFRSEMLLDIPNEISKSYKLWDHETSDHPWLPNQTNGNTDPEVREQWGELYNGDIRIRHKIDSDETLRQFADRFADGKPFMSASEICEIHLVSEGKTLESYEDGTHWADHVLTGDNTRERPYTNLYPRLTSRSNTFRVHMRAQVIRKARSSDPAVFDPEKDEVVSEYEGSSLIERYIDPNDPAIQDSATVPEAEPLTKFYKFRVINENRFTH